MALSHLASHAAPPERARASPASSPDRPAGPGGDARFPDRALSRRRFVRVAAGAAGAALGSRLLRPAQAQAASGPRPIPGGIQLFGPGSEVYHVFFNEPGNEQATITDFTGLIASMHGQGTGTGTDLKSGKTESLLFDADMRIMRGTFRGLDGRTHQGSFGFI